MDETRFDALTKILRAAGSRRVALRALVGSVVATGLGRLGLDETEAKKKKRKKKLKRNSFGCVNVGGKCQGKSANCCSGICQGKKPKKGQKDKSTCLAHDVLDCPAGAGSCQDSTSCGSSGGCWQTTGQASFCGTAGTCVACQKDADCEPARGPGAACIFCPSDCQSTDTACFAAAD